MNLLIVTPIFPPRTGGPSTYVQGIIKHLAKNHNIGIIYLGTEERTIKRVQTYRVDPKGNSVSRQLRLFWKIYTNSLQAEVIYAQGPLVVGVSSVIAAKLRGKRILMKFVGDEAWENARINGQTQSDLDSFINQRLPLNLKLQVLAQRIALSLSDEIIAPSQYLKTFLVKTYQLPDKKINVIPNAIVVDSASVKKDSKKLIFVGRLVPWKNINKIILATIKVREMKDWSLTIIGEGPEEKALKKLVKQHNAEKWIHFLGRLSTEETQKHIASAQTLILYSDYEGLSHTLIEAMLLGTEIIASDIEANRETIRDFGTFVPLDDVSRLTKAIKTPSDKTIKAKTFAQKQYSWKNHIQLLENVI